MAQKKQATKKKSTAKKKAINNADSAVKKIVRWLWILTIVGLLSLIALFFFLSRTGIPSFELLENPESNLATEIYTNDGQVLGRYFVENRVKVDYNELSPNLINALISTEDERYHNHSGIDFRALARVMGKTILMGQNSAGGGSTITQQLAKLLFNRPPIRGGKLSRTFKLVSIKLKEWITAVRLEKSYTKEEIMAMYLNHFNFIHGAYGVKAASEIYFGKSQKEVDVNEAAMLVGLLKNPSLYDPKRFPDKAKARKEVVLSQMMNAGHIDKSTYDSLRVMDVDMSHFQRKTHSEGPAPYFRQELTKFAKELFARDEFKKSNGDKYNLYTDGLKIYTSIDLKIQQHAEEAVKVKMKEVQKRYWRSWRNIDPWKHDAEKDEVKRRQGELDKLVRSSDRFRIAQIKILEPTLTKLEKKYDGYHVKDFDILRMLSEDKKSGAIKLMVAKKLVSKKRWTLYKKIMASDDWALIKSKWSELLTKTEKAFKTKTKMKIFTYDNAKMEKDTTLTPLDSIRYLRMHMQTGLVAIEPSTGHVKAWVGGINHKYFQYDHVLSDRQVGSTFKPFVYATAITMQGISPCYKVDDVQYSIAPGEGNFGILEEWLPHNADSFSYERMTLFEGLRTSTNSVSVYLMKQLGDAEMVRKLVKNMGIDANVKRHDGEFRVPRQPSICLGSADLTAMEMTSAYCTFANNGVYNRPIFVTHIEDKHGKVIYRAIPEEERALPENANYVMVEMLRYAQGSQAAYRGIKSDIGGKTGTTNNYVDGWFIGITPNLVVGSWVGGEDRFIKFRSLLNGQGSRMARPNVFELIKRIEADKSLNWDTKARFNEPKGDIGIITDCDQYENLNYGIQPAEEDPFFDENDEVDGDEEEDDDFF